MNKAERTDTSAPRRASITRDTKETKIMASLALEPGVAKIDTGIGFLDHLLTSLAFHGGMSLELACRGDLSVDDHHTAEDCGIVLGDLIKEALGNRAGIRRFASAYAPLDEALARAVVDVSGRPYAHTDLKLERECIGELACENIPHVLASLAFHAGITLHVEVLYGENDHHKAEAAFKALALACKSAFEVTGSGIASTKGVL
jgi:imidazoleglycerol-phosphate dehydratase